MSSKRQSNSKSVSILHERGTSSVTALKPIAEAQSNQNKNDDVSPKLSPLATLDLSPIASEDTESPKGPYNTSPSGFETSPSFSLSIGNMMIDEENDENILTPTRMMSFRGAFPGKAAFSKAVTERLDTIRRESHHGTFRYDFSDHSPEHKRASKTASARDNGRDTIRLMRRPSALPDVAQSGKLQWRNINIFVGDKGDGKQILHHFTGEISSGQLLAVMGGSGAGKSTFLDALSGRSNLNQLTVEGELAINGHKFKVTKQELIRSLCTFVPQSDVLCPTQTVEEALRFYARLKLPHLTRSQQEKRVQYLIDVLHLKQCRQTVIGDERKRGISGGEKRRCSIAAELLNDADIIFLDEPTSGLDAYTAARTIKTLKQFCLISNKMVIATIHQPAVEVFYLFDHLLLLGGGRLCFHAAINRVDEYFADKISPTQNPADVVIYEAQRQPTFYAKRWANDHDLNPLSHPTARRENNSEWDSFNKIDIKLVENGQIGITHNGDRASWPLQFWKLFRREVMSLYRNWQLLLIRLFQIVFLAAFNGVLFLSVSPRPGIRANFIFMALLTALMYALVTTVTVFPAKKLLLQRESRSGNYGVSPWALSFQIIEIPRESAFMALFTLIVVMLSGVDGPLWQYILVFIGANFAGGSIGIFCGAIARDLKEAALVLPVPLILMIFLSDHLVPLTDFPVFMRPLAEINPLYLLGRILVVVEWSTMTTYVDLKQPPGNRFCSILDVFDQSVMAENRLRERTEGMNCTEILYEINFGAPTPTMSPTVDPDQSIFCPPNMEMTQSAIYNTFNVDPDDFQRWIIQLGAMAVTVRLLAIWILYVMNRDGFSWFRSKLTKCLCCCCCCFKSKSSPNKLLENLIVAQGADDQDLGIIKEEDSSDSKKDSAVTQNGHNSGGVELVNMDYPPPRATVVRFQE